MAVLSPSDEILDDALAPYALISIPSRNIADFILDVTVEEVHNDRLEVTQHPVQTGAVVTDHSFALPATLTIRGASSDSTGGYDGYSRVVYEYFLALQATRTPFSVSTGKRSYNNMLIRDLQITTDITSEFALLATINLQQIKFTDVQASTSSTAMGSQSGSASMMPTVNMGTQTLQPVTTPPPFVAGTGISGIPAVPTPGAGGIGAA